MIADHSSTKRLVMSKDLNGAKRLFGGVILAWIDEQAYIHAITYLQSANVVTRHISAIGFEASAKLGDIVEIHSDLRKLGKTSIELAVRVLNVTTGAQIAAVDRVVMVNVNADGKPCAHGMGKSSGDEGSMSSDFDAT